MLFFMSSNIISQLSFHCLLKIINYFVILIFQTAQTLNLNEIHQNVWGRVDFTFERYFILILHREIENFR